MEPAYKAVVVVVAAALHADSPVGSIALAVAQTGHLGVQQLVIHSLRLTKIAIYFFNEKQYISNTSICMKLWKFVIPKIRPKVKI